MDADRSLETMRAAWSRPRWITVQGQPMRFREAGRGPPLVLVHGLGISSDYWRRTAPPLALSGLRVLAPDLPGFGGSRGAPDGLSVEAQCAALVHWADALEIPRAAWVGHSLSCQVVLELAARYPRRVEALVLAAPTGGCRTRPSIWLQALNLARDALREPPALLPPVLRSYFRAGPRRFWKTWYHAARHDPLPAARGVDAPALVISGARDPVADAAFARRLCQTLPHASHLTLEHGAHAVFFGAWREFNDRVEGFLRTAGGRDATERVSARPTPPPATR